MEKHSISKLLASASLLVGLASAAPSSSPLYNSVIETKYGKVQIYPAFTSEPTGNLTNWKDITVWKGIPFAADTGGENRFRPPQTVNSWNTTLDAKSYGNNIWSPAKSTGAKLPVVMWSYPAESTAAGALFDGGGMADKGIFAAVKWIHENIADFGGNPEHITVMGQSVGSAATYHILNSPLIKGLIKGAIIESGVRDPHDPLCTSLPEGYKTQSYVMAQGLNYTADMNVSTIAELRKLPMSDLEDNVLDGWSFGATLDYYAMPAKYAVTLKEGAANNIPVLTGNTKDESGAEKATNITVAEYLADLGDTYTTGNSLLVGTWMWTQLWATSSTKDVFTYFWDHAPPGQDQGAYHESEINYVLNNLYGTDKPWTAKDYEIAAKMNGYWSNFIKTGNPNGKGLAHWSVTADDELVHHVGNGWGPIPVASKAKVQLFKEWFATVRTY
ncbi:alpha/beta-hydrolase [Penicillium longicatenatum]|uniref:alpha/beta-hydrolase n=1 Tax=Penicillium longicatenatum TaxID=1561947 RepID=UPI0025472377|nr:alpha/beta-hydrolase [Penicillium longicatenatum]KAJ5649647.1 alpha/beta-hydrolase [Penicillium longicatenatum]